MARISDLHKKWMAAGPPILWTPLPMVAAAARLRRPATEARSARGLSKLPRLAQATLGSLLK